MAVPAAVTPGEREVVDEVRLDDAWALVERFATLVRDSGSEDELAAFQEIATRLDAWQIPHQLYSPELLISLPKAASLQVGDRRFRAKTPSMARSTRPGGETAPLVYEGVGFATDAASVLAGGGKGTADVSGRIVVTEGLPMPDRVADIAGRGAVGAVLVSAGDRIHEGICTPVWGSPDLRSFELKPTIPVVSVSNPDGLELIALVEAASTTGTIVAEHDEGWRPIPVLVAEIRGTIEPERFVLLHGHVDSWHVGIGDNATGDATLLESARALWTHRERLTRSVRVAWWSGHSHGRYAGSTWFADTFALDLERNCICHLNCDSPGCRDADVYEDIVAMAEVDALTHAAIRDFAGLPAQTIPPMRAGDISFNNLGISTCFMLGPNVPEELRRRRGYYAVGGCGGNIEWHTEADTLEVADRDRLLRDIRVYTGVVFRAANAAVHPLDFRATVGQIERILDGYRARLEPFGDLGPALTAAAECRDALELLYAKAEAVDSVAAARPINDALLRIGRLLVRVQYARDDRYRQDPALHISPLPELAAAAEAVGSVPDGVLRTEVVRARNRIEGALRDAAEIALAVVA
jgi:N-acetylated-alpha-linked acidic dipeptidase